MAKKDFKSIKWMYHEQTNIMALVKIRHGGLPQMYLCTDERFYDERNQEIKSPFYTYPYNWLTRAYGWLEIGELG